MQDLGRPKKEIKKQNETTGVKIVGRLNEYQLKSPCIGSKKVDYGPLNQKGWRISRARPEWMAES